MGAAGGEGEERDCRGEGGGDCRGRGGATAYVEWGGGGQESPILHPGH